MPINRISFKTICVKLYKLNFIIKKDSSILFHFESINIEPNKSLKKEKIPKNIEK